MIALTAAALLTPLERIERPLVLVEDGIITRLGSQASLAIPNCRLINYGEAILGPGLVDIHIHGGAGHDVMEGDPEVLPVIESFLAEHGVTSYLPTTVTAPLDLTLATLERLADAVESSSEQGRKEMRARPRGIHIEGPFLSHARRGVHPPENLIAPSVDVFERLWQASRGHIKLMTIAPELECALEVIAEAVKRGVAVSLGHSDGGIDAARAGLAAGARHATHTFNAMRPLTHRDPGLLGLVLTDPRISADIIADGIHVDPIVVELFLRMKGPEKAVLITDATAATGMPEGHYRMGAFEFEVRDGKCLANGTLAGSLLTLDVAVQNVMKFAELDLQAALRAATLNPAKAAGLPENAGVLAEGAPADIVVMNSQQKVIKTIVRGAGF
jgi:N-acetylglucosamine-6-phosphate deacetylase